MRIPDHKNSYRYFVAASALAVLLLLSWMLVQMNHFGMNLGFPANASGTNLALQALCQKLPLSFEPNLGQMPAEALFRSQGPGYTLFLTARQAILSMNASGNSPAAGRMAEATVRISPAAMNSDTRLIPENPMAGKANYFLGNQPDKWRTDVPLYAQVRYANAYPGIDLVYYGHQRRLEYDFIVAPGGDPARIELILEGAESIGLDPQGDLRIRLHSGEVQFRQPEIYQLSEKGKVGIAGGFALRGGNRIAFDIGAYDTSQTLIIDPVLSYSSFLGTLGTDGGHGIAVDSAGSIYMTGIAGGSAFPLENPYSGWVGSFEAYVTKFNPAGNALVYSTLLGGSNTDVGYAIAVDAQGSAFIAGKTSSTNFPVVNPVQGTYAGGGSDAFVTKLSSIGNSLVYSTYLGGSGSEGWIGLSGAPEMGIAVHPNGYAYVTGQTSSTNFPTANAFRSTLAGGIDAFVAKIGVAGTPLVFSTYLGGSKDDQARGIAVDLPMRVIVAGETASADFPLVNPFQGAPGGGIDAFVTCFNPAGSGLIYSTYLGGSNNDGANGVALDSSGNAYVTGQAGSTNFPTAAPFQSSLSGEVDAFLSKLNSGGGLVYSTYLGGESQDFGHGVAVDAAGNAHLTGMTHSADFPLANPFQATLGGAVIYKTDNSGTRWIESAAGLKAMQVSAFQLHPSNPATLYAGTDQGMYKSITGGKHWFQINNGLPAESSERVLQGTTIGRTQIAVLESRASSEVTDDVALSGRSILAICMILVGALNQTIEAPASPILFAAAPAAVYRSIDEGMSWTVIPNAWSSQLSVFSMVAVPGFLGGDATGAELDPNATAAVFVLTRSGAYYRAAQDDVTRPWTLVKSGLPASAVVLGAGIGGTVYAGTWNPAQVYKLPAGSSTWTQVSQNWHGAPSTPANIFCLRSDPNNASRLYAGTNVGVFRSTDGGVNWSFLFAPLYVQSVTTMAVDPQNSDIVYAGTNIGPYRSSNGGTDWVPVNTGLPKDEVLSLAVDPINTSILYLGGNLTCDAFVARVNAAGSSLLYSSFLGGLADDWGLSIALHETNGAYVSGVAESADFPIINPFQAIKNDNQDAFLARIIPTNLLNGTPVGSLDTPTNNANVQGIVGIVGWAAIIAGSNASVPTRLDLMVDGKRVGFLAMGVLRPDVRQYFAGQGINAPDNLGYSGLWNSQTVADGNHLISVIAADMTGLGSEARVEIGRANVITGNGIVIPTTTVSSTTTTVPATTIPTTTTTTTTTNSTTTTSSTTTTRPTTTTTLPTVYRRYFPKVTADPLQTTGLAVVNLSLETANLTFKAYANSGNLIASAQRSLAPREQMAQLISELLPTFTQDVGWLLMESSAPSVEGFFLLLDNQVTTMDGAAVSGTLLREFVIPGVDDAEISLVNPGSTPVTCTLQYVNSTGATVNTVMPTIPALGRAVIASSSLRPAGTVGGYLRGSSSGIVALATFGKTAWQAALSAIDAEGASTPGMKIMFAPQYAMGGGYQTILDIVNLEQSETAVTLRLIGDTGSTLGGPTTLTLPARGSVRIADTSIFNIAPGGPFLQGYVRIASTSGRFTGSVRFTDPAEAQFGSALQFTDSSLSQAYFSQVAQNDQYFTGLATLNPNAAATSVTVTVYDTAGNVVASGTRTLPIGGRFSRILTELVGPLPSLTKGYFEVRSDQPVASFALFGTNNGEVLSAIPAQPRSGN